MTPDDFATLLYLGLLGLVLTGSLLIASRGRMGRMMAQASIWALIFLGMIAGFGLWPEIKATILPTQAAVITPEGPAVEVPRAVDGQYYLTLGVNGAPVTFTVDTGATDVVLSRRDALAAGIDPDALAYLGTALTANGPVRTARVSLDAVTLEGVTERGVPAVVTRGALEGSLLGMAYLDRFSRIEIAGGRLLLTR
jgi:aspartyl protease family protein